MATGAVEGERKPPRPPPRPKIRLSPIGFWSYSRRDDELSRGRLSQLRSLLLAELQTQYGRDGIQLFQDVSAIPHGADWERITTGAIDQSTFFIPIVTPFYMQSRWCARETKMFEAREGAIFQAHPDLSRDRRRVFPLLWIDVKNVEAIDEEAAAALKVAQWCDFSHLRHRNLDHDEEVLAKVAAFARSIVEVLQLKVEAPLSEAEREERARDVDEARRRAKEEAREAERLRLEQEAAARAEAAREVAKEERRARKQKAAERRAAIQRAQDQEARRAFVERAVATLKSQGIRLIAIAAFIALITYLIWPRLFGHREASAPTDSPAVTVLPPNESTPRAATIAPRAAQGPSLDWLFGRWCVGGNRANVQTISGDRTRIIIAFGGSRQSEAVRGVEQGLVVTEIARYRRNGEALVIEEMGREQRLERCE